MESISVVKHCKHIMWSLLTTSSVVLTKELKRSICLLAMNLTISTGKVFISITVYGFCRNTDSKLRSAVLLVCCYLWNKINWNVPHLVATPFLSNHETTRLHFGVPYNGDSNNNVTFYIASVRQDGMTSEEIEFVVQQKDPFWPHKCVMNRPWLFEIVLHCSDVHTLLNECEDTALKRVYHTRSWVYVRSMKPGKFSAFHRHWTQPSSHMVQNQMYSWVCHVKEGSYKNYGEHAYH